MRRGTRGRGYGGRPPVSHRPQNNIPRQLQPQQSQCVPQPLMTSQLQGLKDIDLELELLKRKREIIEQQQQMLGSCRQNNDYEQPNYSQAREKRYDDYPRLYNNPQESNQYGGRGGRGGYDGRGEGSRKRPRIPVWENEAPIKRFSPSTRGKKPFNSRSSPAPNPRPDFQRYSPPKINRPSGPQKRKEFNPTKVTKPSPVPLMTLACYQPAQRKKLVIEAMASGAGKPCTAADELVLRVDREPSHLITGRLELALGAIMKELKNANPQHEELFKQPHSSRTMKQCVRDRLRVAMMGKSVTTVDHIKLAYYEHYPLGKDHDVVNAGIMAHEGKDFVTIDTENAEMFFKKNMRNLMILKMEEMVEKLQEIYGNSSLTMSKLYRHKNYRKLEEEAQADKTPETNETSTTGNVRPEKTIPNQPENNNGTQTQEAVQTNEGVEAVKEADTNAPAAQNKPKPVYEKPEAKGFVIPKDIISTEQYHAYEKLITFKMLHLLKRFSSEFVKNMELNAMYRKAKAAIYAETAKKLGVQPAFTEEPGKEDDQDTITTIKIKRPPLLSMYYVKIQGKPSLPKRKSMEHFFEQYKPKSIKKHKAVHNLLFVGFIEKESYERILAADGIKIGRSILDIKVSEKTDNKTNPTTDKSSVNIKAEKLNDSTDNAIDADLDNQITDLLTSIRNSDSDNFAEDIDIAVPPRTDVKNGNGDQTVKIEQMDCQGQNADNEDVVEPKHITQDDDVVEVKNASQNDEVKDASQNDEIQDASPKDEAQEASPKDEVQDASQKDEVQDASQNDEIQDASQNDEVQDASQNDEVKDVSQNDEVNDVVEPKDNGNNDDVAKVIDQAKPEITETVDSEEKDTVGQLPERKDVKGTPTRSSARLATPGGIRTRRMSKLAE